VLFRDATRCFFEEDPVKKIVFVATVVSLALMGLTVPTFADTITVSPTPSITGAGPYTWTYAVSLTGFSSIDAGDFFTILDFDGFVPGSQSVNVNWIASSANSGICPGGVYVTCLGLDDPTIPNLSWTYTGPLVANASVNSITPLGDFSAVSIYNRPINDQFLSQDNDLQTVSQNEGASGGTNVPAPTTVPEPSSLLLLGSGLLSLAALARRQTAK
jgi:hypothetical protein